MSRAEQQSTFNTHTIPLTLSTSIKGRERKKPTKRRKNWHAKNNPCVVCATRWIEASGIIFACICTTVRMFLWLPLNIRCVLFGKPRLLFRCLNFYRKNIVFVCAYVLTLFLCGFQTRILSDCRRTIKNWKWFQNFYLSKKHRNTFQWYEHGQHSIITRTIATATYYQWNSSLYPLLIYKRIDVCLCVCLFACDVLFYVANTRHANWFIFSVRNLSVKVLDGFYRTQNCPNMHGQYILHRYVY